MVFPVIQRISPQLAIAAEIIRRHPGNMIWPALRVEIKEITVRPDIGAFQRDIDGHVTDDLDTVVVGAAFYSIPLFSKFVLQELMEQDFLGVGFPGLLQSLGVVIPEANVFPQIPVLPIELFF